jgi:hypothetical protein
MSPIEAILLAISSVAFAIFAMSIVAVCKDFAGLWRRRAHRRDTRAS